MSPPFYADKTHLLVYLDDEGVEHPITRRVGWQRRRAHILASMQEAMGPLPPRQQILPLQMEVLASEELDGLIRRKMTFVSQGDDRVPAYLIMPRELAAPAPAMLCLHQTTRIGKGEPAGVDGLANLHYALELAQRGCVTLAPDYPGYGDYTCDPYALGYASATMKGIWNHMRAVDVLQSLPEVDSGRIGCIGHSLGGHNTLFVAAFDDRIQVMVSSCGFNSFFQYYGGDLAGWSHSGYMPRIIEVYDKDPARMPFDFTEVVAAMAPRPLFVNAPLHDDNFEVSGVRACIEAAKPVYDLFGAGDRLVAVYPDAEHDFPPAVREEAYAFVQQHLG